MRKDCGKTKTTHLLLFFFVLVLIGVLAGGVESVALNGGGDEGLTPHEELHEELWVRLGTPEAERYFEMMRLVLDLWKERPPQEDLSSGKLRAAAAPRWTVRDLRVLRELLGHRNHERLQRYLQVAQSRGQGEGRTSRLLLREVGRIPLHRCSLDSNEAAHEHENGHGNHHGEMNSMEQDDGVCLGLLLDSRSHGTQHYHLWYSVVSSASSQDRTVEDLEFIARWRLMGPFTARMCSACHAEVLQAKARYLESSDGAILEARTLTSTVNNGSGSIEELIDLSREAKCVRDEWSRECKRGTVEPASAWLAWALEDQSNRSTGIGAGANAASDLSLPYLTMVNTHNSYNNKADGYGDGDFTLSELLRLVSDGTWDFVWAQQWFTMTDQLNLGARSMMLDPVWFDEEIRLCHCGTTFPWFDKVLQFLEKELHKNFSFDSNDLGCTPFDRPYSEGVQEIAEWVQLHPSEIILLNINDEGPSADWDHQALIQNETEAAFGSLLFTPLSKVQHTTGEWPTATQMIGLGQRVFAHGDRVNDSSIFPGLLIPEWDQDTMKYFARSPYPACMGYVPGEWTTFGGESQVIGPIYNGPKEEGLVTLENMGALLDCGVSEIGMDLASPLLFAAYVWTWLPGEPSSSPSCAAISSNSLNATEFGRWATFPCDGRRSFPAACASTPTTPPYSLLTNWTITSQTFSSWSDAAAACESLGLQFAAPVCPFSNRKLKDALLAFDSNADWVWINQLAL